MLHLSGRKITILLILLFVSSTIWGQVRKSYNYREFSKKPYYFGISLGYNSSNYVIQHSSKFILNDEFRRAESINGPGFNVGVIGNLKIGEYFDLRTIPSFSFAERNIVFQTTDGSETPIERTIESVFFEMPFLVRYKSRPYKDMRLFVLGGIKYSYDMANNSKARQAETLIKISPHDFALELGAGVQFFFPYFIFSPEIKFSHGLGNILIYNNDLEESTILDKILSRTFTFSLNFEG